MRTFGRDGVVLGRPARHFRSEWRAHGVGHSDPHRWDLRCGGGVVRWHARVRATPNGRCRVLGGEPRRSAWGPYDNDKSGPGCCGRVVAGLTDRCRLQPFMRAARRRRSRCKGRLLGKQQLRGVGARVRHATRRCSLSSCERGLHARTSRPRFGGRRVDRRRSQSHMRDPSQRGGGLLGHHRRGPDRRGRRHPLAANFG